MCERIQMPGGGVAIICGVRRRRRPACVHCGQPSAFECDGPPRTPRHQTCDNALCRRCRIHVPPNKDFCQHHRVAAADAAGQLRLFDGERTQP